MSGSTISNGTSAPSTTPFDNASGSAGTGMPTGSAFQASIIHAPVREGVRSFNPRTSSTERTAFSRK